jgi:hypothetical protein
MDKRRVFIGVITMILGVIMILSQILSLYIIDYFAGDCIPRFFRFGLIIIYIILISGGFKLLRSKSSSKHYFLIAGFGLIINSIILFLIDIDCMISSIYYQHLIWGLIISTFTFKFIIRKRLN